MTCSGKCCAVFNWPTPPAKMRERWSAANPDDSGNQPHMRDDLFIADMLIGLSPEEAQERALRFEITPPEGHTLQSWSEQSNLYTCSHWDEETRLCTAYDERPRMCADYPYAKKCQHDCDCTYRPPMNVRTEWSAIEVRRVVEGS